MQVALELAAIATGQTSPNPLVGCVLVRDGFVVGQGAHLRAGGPHAEVHAIRMAGDAARGATAYVTLEPCSHTGRTPPCADALIEAGVARVVVATTDPNPLVSGRGIARLRAAGIDVTVGVRAEQAASLNEAFLTWAMKRRPFVVWKCAATLDGRIAASTGQSQFVTGAVARQEVQRLRRQYPAVVVGAGTVRLDNPRLTVRGENGDLDHRQPIRVVFDSKLTIPTTAQLFAQPGQTLVYTTQRQSESSEYVEALRRVSDGVEVIETAADNSGRVSLAAALTDLGGRGVHSVLVEGGAQLATAFLQEHLVDKLVYFIAPKLLRQGVLCLQGQATSDMSEAISLRDVSWHPVGEDLCVTGYPDYGPGGSNASGAC